MKYLRLSLGFLTVIPVKSEDQILPGDLGRAAGWFPWIGMLIGLGVALVHGLGNLLFPPLLAACLATASWAALTGGLHLDGLADCCDGLLNASTPQRRLEIMKDPRLGSFGGIGLFLALFLKTAALASLPPLRAAVTIGLATCLGRWLILLACRQPVARPGGMGADFAAGFRPLLYLPAAVPVVLLSILAGWYGLIALLAAHLVALAAIALANSRIGGLTGDVLGLIVELSELSVLLVFCQQAFAL